MQIIPKCQVRGYCEWPVNNDDGQNFVIKNMKVFFFFGNKYT